MLEAFQGELSRQLHIRGFPNQEAIACFRRSYPWFKGVLELFDPQKETFYQQVDVVIVPSVWLENQPVVILEAFAYGKPVLASHIGGLPEIFAEGKGGRFFSSR